MFRYDLIFDDADAYAVAKYSASLDAPAVAAALGLGDISSVLRVYCADESRALKIMLARRKVAGAAGDRDVYGAQQHRALLDLVL